MPVKGLNEVVARFEKAAEQVKTVVKDHLLNCGNDIASVAKMLVPVRTGYLRNSIVASVQFPMRLYVVAKAPYAAYVEFGTRDMAPQPFMYPALKQRFPQLFEDLKGYITALVEA